jgi:hypothetical protein
LQWKINITYSDYVFVALGIQHAMRMCCIVICGLYGSRVLLPHCLIIGRILGKKERKKREREREKKGKVTYHKMCVLIFSTTLL